MKNPLSSRRFRFCGQIRRNVTDTCQYLRPPTYFLENPRPLFWTLPVESEGGGDRLSRFLRLRASFQHLETVNKGGARFDHMMTRKQTNKKRELILGFFFWLSSSFFTKGRALSLVLVDGWVFKSGIMHASAWEVGQYLSWLKSRSRARMWMLLRAGKSVYNKATGIKLKYVQHGYYSQKIITQMTHVIIPNCELISERAYFQDTFTYLLPPSRPLSLSFSLSLHRWSVKWIPTTPGDDLSYI